MGQLARMRLQAVADESADGSDGGGAVDRPIETRHVEIKHILEAPNIVQCARGLEQVGAGRPNRSRGPPGWRRPRRRRGA